KLFTAREGAFHRSPGVLDLLWTFLRETPDDDEALTVVRRRRGLIELFEDAGEIELELETSAPTEPERERPYESSSRGAWRVFQRSGRGEPEREGELALELDGSEDLSTFNNSSLNDRLRRRRARDAARARHTFDVPALGSEGQLAAWLGVTPGDLDWFADTQGRLRR